MPALRAINLAPPKLRIDYCIEKKSNSSITSSVDNILGGAGSNSSSNILALEVGEKAGVRASESARRAVGIRLTSMAKVVLALSVGVAIGRSKHATTKARLHSLNNVLEDVALGDDLTASIDLERVSAVSIEVVTDGMEHSVAGNLG